ncbi:MAG TPA: hypothetical protein VMJ66_02075 [Geobacteraceae bacterium]|nr:hypothetical protein [Geobacteraceae bacterium]
MRVGFNHNIMYKGEVFHIQTEDSGISNPHIITLLYRGGTIISSKKTSYADIIKMENLPKVVEELMQEQHKDMLRSLKAGQFDERAFGSRPTPSEKEDNDIKPSAGPPPESSPPHRQHPHESPRPTHSLDEIILDYLVRGEDT